MRGAKDGDRTFVHGALVLPDGQLYTFRQPSVFCSKCPARWRPEALCDHHGPPQLSEPGDLYAQGALYARDIEDGRAVCVLPMTYGKARLCLSEGQCFVDGYCYQDPGRAVQAAMQWTGEGDPLDGWHRNPFDGRRREDGDPAKETFAP